MHSASLEVSVPNIQHGYLTPRGSVGKFELNDPHSNPLISAIHSSLSPLCTIYAVRVRPQHIWQDVWPLIITFSDPSEGYSCTTAPWMARSSAICETTAITRRRLVLRRYTTTMRLPTPRRRSRYFQVRVHRTSRYVFTNHLPRNATVHSLHNMNQPGSTARICAYVQSISATATKLGPGLSKWAL